MIGKPLVWLGSARNAVRCFPEDARRMVGFELRRVQIGLEPRDWKPMLDIGLGVREIRIRTELQFRVLYVARYREAVYVLHAFEKRSTKTSRRDLELAKQRMRLLSAERSRQGG